LIMKNISKLTSGLILITSLCLSVNAQTWSGLDASGDEAFYTAGNWVGGVAPVSGAANLVIGSQSTGTLYIDNVSFQAASLTVNSGITFTISNFGAESLTITGGGLIMNGTSLTFAAPVVSGAASTWNINSGSVVFGNAFDLSVGLLTINMAAGTNVTFGAAPTWNGTGINFTGAGVTASSITAPGFAGNIAKVQINGAAAQLSGGNIVPTVIPEPSTYATLAGVFVLGLVASRRRKVATV
jgi:hypothetical protein